MGAYDLVKVCELVGLFLLNKVNSFYNKSNICPYRDDGLAVFKSKNGQQLEKIKNSQNLLKNLLKIVVYPTFYPSICKSFKIMLF